ncbi:hypothetical protein Halru_1016 [Halovivax ruber XH-70]|uniref:Membrane-associated, metal-dependent hydrolase n=1 Tax=Halovivax ruber (strain DSM 18193 / JCM 13892 / XH-70) TaxID=797302 RepID=L0I7R4_HALRX|nr:hypothetical protein [Halovivax ruber]AGB15635.1 hypothetical protein Halru_1016 [Halovivax ruber XH-70]
MRDKLQKSKKILREEGLVAFLSSVSSYLSSRIIPLSSKNLRPSADASQFPIVWYLKPIYNILFRLKYGNGSDIMDDDWDTLILLDACRYDDFDSVCDISGDLSHRISHGVDSPTFIKKNFSGNRFEDTVYVTANPHAHMIEEDNFYKVDATPIEKWDSTMECVMPEEVTKAAIEAHNHNENKRIIVHYMQPHDPPIGPTGRKLLTENNISGMRSDVDDRYIGALIDGIISEEDARCAYRENLSIVLQEVRNLVERIDGKVVVSSDHGEMFGEKPYRFLPKLYEHYHNPKTIELCKVPWLEIKPESERRVIQSGEGDGAVDIGENALQEQLEALGYK